MAPREVTELEQDARPGPADVARSDLISWSSIVAGLLAAFALFVLFGAIGVGAGLEGTNPKFGREVGLIIAGLLGVLAFIVGGFIAAWTAEIDEQDTAIMHGFLVWALFVVLLLILISMGAGSALGDAGNIFSSGFVAQDAKGLSDAAWASVFALAIALVGSILGAVLAIRPEIKNRHPFARR